PPDLLINDTQPRPNPVAKRKRAGSRTSGTNPPALGMNPRALRSKLQGLDAPQMKFSNTIREVSSRSNLERVKRVQGAVERPRNFVSPPPSESFTRPRATTSEPETLTPEQQALDQRLREWRKAESEKLNLPLFFVLAST